jgi:pectate lyase
VDYGDGTGTQPATVNLTGGSGTVTGPTHTYSTPGPYTLTVVISTTAATTIPVNESITVTGPTVTGLSKTTIKRGKSLSTTVSGTNFDGTGARTGFTTSDSTNISVTSVTFKPATKKKAATYKVELKAVRGAPDEQVSLILTQTGAEAGQYTDVNAVTIS